MPKLTQQAADKATQIRTDLNARVDAVRSNPDLSTVGRQRAIAAAYVAHRDRMDQLRSGFVDDATTTATDLSRQLFGAGSVSGADAISVRDAADRASQLDPGDAEAGLALLARAELNGDEILARAVAAVAFQYATALGALGQPWTAVVDTFAASRPAVAQQLQALSDAQANTTADAFQVAMHLALPRPSEVDRVPENELAQMVLEAPQTITSTGW